MMVGAFWCASFWCFLLGLLVGSSFFCVFCCLSFCVFVIMFGAFWCVSFWCFLLGLLVVSFFCVLGVFLFCWKKSRPKRAEGRSTTPQKAPNAKTTPPKHARGRESANGGRENCSLPLFAVFGVVLGLGLAFLGLPRSVSA